MFLCLPQLGGIYQDIVRVAHDANPPCLPLLVKFLQVDVGKEMRDAPSLGASDFGFLHCAILHDSCLEEVAYEWQ